MHTDSTIQPTIHAGTGRRQAFYCSCAIPLAVERAERHGAADARLRPVRAADRRQPEPLVSAPHHRRLCRAATARTRRPRATGSSPDVAMSSRCRASPRSPRRPSRARSSSASSRSRARSSARSPRRTTCSRRRRCRSRARRCSGSATACSGSSTVPLEQIRVVRSHPAALDQCRRLLAAMPWATAIAAGTTAEAAADVAERGDPEEAAIAGERAADAVRPDGDLR